MSKFKTGERALLSICKLFFSVKEKKSFRIEKPTKLLIIRQHNQFGDLLASISLFRAVKYTYPDVELNVVLGPQNYYGATKNRFIDNYFVFDKKKLTSLKYIKSLYGFLRQNYDLVIVPATVSISTTSSLLARFSDAKNFVGPRSLDGNTNKFEFLFSHRIDLNWALKPDCHVADFGLDIVRPLGISTNNYKSNIEFDENDKRVAEEFYSRMVVGDREVIIGCHVGAGKPGNRWPLDNFVALIKKLNRNYNAKFFLTGSDADSEQIDYVEDKLSFSPAFAINKSIPELAAIIDKADLFITNDTGVMHVAGATKVNQVSIFGPTNPKNWAPVGENKYSFKNSDDIKSVDVDEVFEQCLKLLN